MAFLTLNFHSDALGMASEIAVILPQSATTQIGMGGSRTEEFKTLYLLHGLSDDHTIWERRTSIERYASRYGIAVVMPNAHRSWYCDMAHGGNYYTYIAKEVPALCRSFFRGMSDKKEMNYIAGLSMGGYGALKIALRNPGAFAGVASFSGALDPADSDHIYIDASYWADVFGPFEKIRVPKTTSTPLRKPPSAKGRSPKKSISPAAPKTPFSPAPARWNPFSPKPPYRTATAKPPGFIPGSSGTTRSSARSPTSSAKHKRRILHLFVPLFPIPC